MERLTKRIERELVVFTQGEYIDTIPAEMTHEDIRKVLRKLAEYEDAEKQGLLLRLPCKVGDTVYRYVEEKDCVLEYTVWNISMSAYESGGIDIVIEGCAESEDEVEDEFSLSLIDFKNEFFNTREEAEAEKKLKEMESD